MYKYCKYQQSSPTIEVVRCSSWPKLCGQPRHQHSLVFTVHVLVLEVAKWWKGVNILLESQKMCTCQSYNCSTMLQGDWSHYLQDIQCSHVTPVLFNLHWLLVSFRKGYQETLLTCTCKSTVYMYICPCTRRDINNLSRACQEIKNPAIACDRMIVFCY